MAAGDANAWARLRLVQGTSARSSWELSSAGGERRITIGSHPSCQWVIEDSSVDAMHLVLHWDEASLSVARANDLASVRLDGQPVGPAFVRVGGRARLEFGRCAIVAETSAGGVRISQAPPPSSNPPPQPNLAKTLMGVSPLAATPLRADPAAEPAVKISRAVHTGSSAPPEGERPHAYAAVEPQQKIPKGTVVGLGPAVAAVNGARGGSGSGEGRRDAAGHESLASTRYGMGDDVRAHAVDFVSPERLRRSSVPPAPAAELGASRRPGRGDADEGHRATQFGFSEVLDHAAFVESQPTDLESSEDKRLVDDTDQIRQLSEVKDHPVVARTRRLTPARSQPGVPEAEVRPRVSMRPPVSGGRSPALTIVLTLAALLGLGAWVYALTTL